MCAADFRITHNIAKEGIYTPMYADRDLGAYEMQGIGDRIFIDTFGDNLLLVH